MSPKRDLVLDFPSNWNPTYTQTPEYKIINRLVNLDPEASEAEIALAVDAAVDEIAAISQKLLDETTLPPKEELDKDKYYHVVDFQKPRNALCRHLIIVIASWIYIGVHTPHQHHGPLVDFLEQLCRTKEIKPKSRTLEAWFNESPKRGRIWIDLPLDDTFSFVERELLNDDEKPHKLYGSSVTKSPEKMALLDNRFALVARLTAKFKPDPIDDLEDREWEAGAYNSMRWTNLALRKLIIPVMRNVFDESYYDEKWVPEMTNPYVPITAIDSYTYVTEPLLRGAAMCFVYNSQKIWEMSCSGEDYWREHGKDPYTEPINRYGHESWNRWRVGFETYLGAQRIKGNRHMSDLRRLSDEAEDLIRQALEAMDASEKSGYMHDNIDWEHCRERIERGEKPWEDGLSELTVSGEEGGDEDEEEAEDDDDAVHSGAEEK